MEPTKQESVSRQSSILKAPKQRQPLQCVATNTPSAESSPTIKIKRRVSFAKNKRIREFCNEVEPKEGLDDSYEEHDLSNTKSSSGNSTDHPLVISVACEDKENFPIQLFLPTDQFECKEVSAPPVCTDGDNLSQSEMEMDISINNFQTANSEMQKMQNKEMTIPNTTIYFDDGMDITTSIQPQIIAARVQDGDCDDTVPVSQSSVEYFPMEITENLPLTLPKNVVHTQNTNHYANVEYNFSNFTEPISTILGIGLMKKPIETQSTKLLTGSSENETECFTDMPLEFTSVIPSSTWIKPHNHCTNNEKTERSNCKTMEFTEVIQPHNIVNTQSDSQSNISQKQIQLNEVSQDKMNILCDNSITLKEASSDPNVVYQNKNVNHNLLDKLQERTNIFSNASIEITEAVPVCHKIEKLTTCMKENQQEIVQEKTKIFFDQSLELTGVPNNEIHQMKNSEVGQLQRQEKTKFFLDASMEMTEAISNQNRIDKYFGSNNKIFPPSASKTKVFFNTSMDITEAVLTNHKIGRPVETERKNHAEDKTKLFNDNSMEITEALNHNKIKKLGHCQSQFIAPGNEKTQLFFNTSMEMTEAVPINSRSNAPILTMDKTHQEMTENRTKIFYNKSMEVTEAVVHHSKISLLSKFDNQTHDLRQEKTNFFINASMEMTEGVPALLNKIHQPIANTQKINKDVRQDISQFCCNKSMEITEAVPVYHLVGQSAIGAEKNQQAFTQDGTKIFQDKSMEITEAVPNRNRSNLYCNSKSQSSGSEKTKFFNNASMEITEAASMVNITQQLGSKFESVICKNKPEQTEISQDKSMEMTEAVLNKNKSNLYCNSKNQSFEQEQEKNKFFNASMEITESAPTVNGTQQLGSKFKNIICRNNSEPTEIFQDKSMEMPEAVLNRDKSNLYFNSESQFSGQEQEKTELFNNASTENTEAAPVVNRTYQLGSMFKSVISKNKPEQTEIFQDKSMEMTEAVLNGNKSNLYFNSKNQFLEQEQEKTESSNNASMEITEAAPMVNRIHQLGSKLKSAISENIPEQTEIFQDKSMEMTEAIKNIYTNTYDKSVGNSKISNEMQEKIRELPSHTPITETIPVNKEIWCDIQNNESISKQPKELSINDRVMDQSSNLLENLRAQTIDNKTMNILRNERTQLFNNKSMDFTEIIPVLEHRVLNYDQNNAPNLMTDKTEVFFNNSMDITEAVMKNQNTFPPNPVVSSNSVEDSERLNQYDSILPNIQKSVNANHSSIKKDKSSYRDKSFQRMTTDELNTLCASMNLPTQNYTTEKSSTLQNEYISICNDVNVLRDSLQKNTIFQQNFTIGTDINVATDKNVHIPTVTPCKTISQISPSRIESQKEYDAMNTHDLKGNEICKGESTEMGIKNLEYQKIFRDLSKSLTNPISRNGTECSNLKSFQDSKQACETQSNIYSLDKNETLQTHNTSVNLSNTRKSSVKRKSTEIYDNPATTENTLTRLPSDNTDLLIATMGVKTKLSYPLIINDRTTIKIPNRSSGNNIPSHSSYSNENISTEENVKYLKNITTPSIENEVFDEECNSLNKENKSPEERGFVVRTELFPENSMNELDEIQPPSFLCSGSFQTDSMIDAQVLDNKQIDIISSEIIQDDIDLTFEKQYGRENNESPNPNDCSAKETRYSYERDSFSTNSTDRVDTPNNLNEKSSETVNKLVFFNHSKDRNESMISLINEENVNTDPLAPFSSLTKSIEAHQKRDDCIWTIRKIDQKTVAVDFISRSFVTIIRLNEIEKACIKDIDNIEFISRFHCGSKNILLKIVHRLLLSKLNPDKLLSEYKMYEDVLPLLDYISNEVVLAIDFMFDLERLSALNILNVENERVLFMVSSKKANIILEISLTLKIFNEIGPDDVNVTCVLGDVRINDIKQLIVNIRKDASFLSRYIRDIKDYIMIMEESTHTQR